ncbi:MAG: PP2C family protein-serine/threonine phosphatase [Planctomycetota bacterium]
MDRSLLHSIRTTQEERRAGGGLLTESLDLVSMHKARSFDDLREQLGLQLTRCLPGRNLAVLAREENGSWVVEYSQGTGCPLQCGQTLDTEVWSPEEETCLPMLYGTHETGKLILQGPVNAEVRAELDAVMKHFTVALTTLHLNEDAAADGTSYMACLQAFKESMSLFEENDVEAIAARFLDICTTLLQASAGAIFLLEGLGSRASSLKLEHAWGMPDSVLEGFRHEDGSRLPEKLLVMPIQFLERNRKTGLFPGLDNDSVPPVLQNLTGGRFMSQDKLIGVCMLFNVNREDPAFDRNLGTLELLLNLEAALLHRYVLEAQALRNRQLETELQIASQLQRKLLPQRPPENRNMDFAFRSIPASMVGGDYLDFVEGASGDIHAIIADVSGHGVNSALMMTSFRATYRSRAHILEPDLLLTHLNRAMCKEVVGTSMFLTSATLTIRSDGKHINFASAGHNPLYLYRHSEDVFLELEPSGPPLGFFPESKYDCEEIETRPGDVLFLYTDGLVEARKAGSDLMFGEERLMSLIRAHAAQSASEMLEASVAAVEEFSRREQAEDDISISIVKFL